MDGQQEQVCDIDGRHTCIHGNLNYNSHPFLGTPFAGAVLTTAISAASKKSERVTVTIEWLCKEIKLY